MKITALAVAAMLTAGLTLAGCGSSAGQPHVASLSTPSVASSAAGGGDQSSGQNSDQSSGKAAGSGDHTDAGTTDTAPEDSTVSDDSGPIAGRPQFRLDDTDARRTALVNAYSSCLLQHGAPKADNGSRAGAAGPGVSDLVQVGDPVPPAAASACLHLLPVMPPEEEAATNPDFHAQSLKYVGCMQQKGLWVQLLNSHDLDWTYTDGHPVPDDESTIEQTCLEQAFSS
jgi:hypothetical protein